MSFFDFDGRFDESGGVGSAISRREAVLVSLLAHAIFVIVMLLTPDAPWLVAQADVIPVMPAQDQQSLPFMLVETTAQPTAPPERPRVASDLDRRAASAERAPQPSNDMPFSRGNSADMLDGTPAKPARGPVTPAPPSPTPPAPPLSTSPGMTAPVRRPAETTPASGGLGESLRNIDQLIKRERFDNPTGGPNINDATISFDSKGVDFGPWLTRFVAQVKRNWLIPYAAMTMHGRVVVTFYVHRDGRISELTVIKPSSINAFNTAAFQALVQSNPTLRLPPEYPDDKVLFTVTFFYNERPGGGLDEL